MADEIEVEEVAPKAPPKKATAKKAPAKKAPAKKTRARNEDGHFVADDPSTPDVNEAYVQEVEEPVAEVVAETVTVEAETNRARIKGTWRMYFSGQPYDFTDGEYYDLPPDLYNYLRGSGNIYDTLS